MVGNVVEPPLIVVEPIDVVEPLNVVDPPETAVAVPPEPVE